MRTKKYRLWAAALAVTVTGFTACLKSDDNVTPQRPQAAYVFLNASTYSAGVDIFHNSTKLTNNGPFKFGAIDDYYTYGGTQEFVFKAGGKDSTVGSILANFDSTKYYTMVIYGENPQVRAVENDFTNASNTKVNYRFYQLSPSEGAVDLFIDGKKVDSMRSYDGGALRSGFMQLDPVGTSRLTVKAAGTDSVLAENTSPLYPLQTGGVFTIYYTGLKGTTGDYKPTVNTVISYF
ncbi:DUF4397 domain-containing protein [Chitinophaga japonensis]|uniref:Uncharacterized protein DUF4397 n=1 Tax=Chitinophaga japonensis TaxID=104662 RepID=A0A562T5V1_CHIJA|nr:DUF4397 domain-containing protein [Chitinophaga japonensis]TWI88921.1 uncharacterized protein DUF4397 [Chitinophaga japonensis]